MPDETPAAPTAHAIHSPRIGGEPAELYLAYAESTGADSHMIAEDILGSQAHALMLARQGIISEADLREILRHLAAAREAFVTEGRPLARELEDVHMNVERFVTEGAGPEMGGRLHTARSRNDQVALDCKLHLRSRLLHVRAQLARLQTALLDRATGEELTVMPGYTHTQHAQPISAAFWLTAHVSAFCRDQERLAAAFGRTNTLPLGACALAGTSFPTDRALVARLLAFDGVHEHALDAVGSRDFVAEALSALAICMTNVSRLAEECVLFSTREFGLIELPDAFTSGSSIMPQKKNPCLAELARARAGLVTGRLVQLLTLLKGLLSGYNRDLQDDKPPLWEALDVTELTLTALAAAVAGITLQRDRMAALADANFATATELANWLVRDRGLPFRQAHHLVGGVVVRTLLAEGLTLSARGRVAELLAAHDVPATEEELAFLEPAACLQLQQSLGSTGPDEVRRMTAALRTCVEQHEAHVRAQQERLAAAAAHAEQVAKAIVADGVPLSLLEL